MLRCSWRLCVDGVAAERWERGIFAKLQAETLHSGTVNLTFLDLVEEHWTWCGNANELNAAYAADGYARVKQVCIYYTSTARCETALVHDLTARSGLGDVIARTPASLI